MAARFWVGGNGTWDNSSTTHWSTSSGGANGAAAPTSADAVTFDGNSGAAAVINVAANVSASTVALGSTGGQFTGTLDFTNGSTGNFNGTFGQFGFSGTGSRTIKFGTGIFTFNGASGTIIDFSTTTGLTGSDASSATFTFNGTLGTSPNIIFGTSVLGNIGTVNFSFGGSSNKFKAQVAGFGSMTIGTLNITTPAWITLTNGVTLTVTNPIGLTGGTSLVPVVITSTNSPVATTISNAAASVGNWVATQAVTFTGGGTLTLNNSFDLGGNTGITINAPRTGLIA